MADKVTVEYGAEYWLTDAAEYTVFWITSEAASSGGAGRGMNIASGANGIHCDGRYIPVGDPVPDRLGQPVPLTSSAAANSGGMSTRLDSA